MSAIVANVAVDVFQTKPLSNDRHDRSDRRLDQSLNHLISADSMLFMKEEQKSDCLHNKFKKINMACLWKRISGPKSLKSFI